MTSLFQTMGVWALLAVTVYLVGLAVTAFIKEL